ncbi:hypothetical protein M8C21_004669 [Ambrosia artemisiifolia]|uniref:DNA topoisomerase I catalytic core eukaryotic-type domain-containing protein n=1 Tax=Ambrosia artemisiifolia TaxID=4212 RepID=A0AAD5DB08_AMBAR|nr:hypothetical protein M8C21_004669 [Ambrosia artemisiifolia]
MEICSLLWFVGGFIIRYIYFRYVFLAASSALKDQSDKEKYEKARSLKNYIEGIRQAYTKDFGNKDDDDEADTVGCCTLKVENVEPKPPNILKAWFFSSHKLHYH